MPEIDNEKSAELSKLELAVVNKVLSEKDLSLDKDERVALRSLLSSGGVILSVSNGRLTAKKRVD
jgi:hypothetical protein